MKAARDIPKPRRIPRGLFCLCLLSVFGLALLPLLQVGDGKSVPPFALFLGRFHPVILHVPIGLIVLALILQHAHIRGLREWIPKVPPETSTFLMFCAALSAVISTVLGWMLSYSGGYDPVLLQRHFVAGLVTAIGANLALLFKLVSEAYPANRSAVVGYQLALLTTGVALALAGHLGASITHGADYLTEYAPNPVRRFLGLPARVDPAEQTLKPLPDRIVFTDVIQPLLTERCVACHSGQKAKGGLRLDSWAELMKGGTSGVVVIPGQPGKSNLLRYLDLPENDPKHMPPKGKTQVTESEQTILDWWVTAGAPENKTIGEMTVPDDVKLALETAVPAPLREKQEAEKRAKVAKLAAIVADLQKRLPGTLRALAPGGTDLEFSAVLDPAHFGNEQLRALAKVGDELIWLDLQRTAITDAGLKTVAKMHNLRRLQLQETKVTDAGLMEIKTLPKLEALNLYDTKVTDAGLAALGSMPKLRRLYVWQTSVTESGQTSLRKKLPKLEIVTAGPAMAIVSAAVPSSSASAKSKTPEPSPWPSPAPTASAKP